MRSACTGSPRRLYSRRARHKGCRKDAVGARVFGVAGELDELLRATRADPDQEWDTSADAFYQLFGEVSAFVAAEMRELTGAS